MPKLATVALVMFTLAVAAPAKAGEQETSAAAQTFISALAELDGALHRYYDLLKAAKIPSYLAPTLCAEVSPDPAIVPDEHVPVNDLLKQNNISLPDARVLCDALAAERNAVDKTKAANLAAADACRVTRVPACDLANEAVAAQKASRARMEVGGQQ